MYLDRFKKLRKEIAKLAPRKIKMLPWLTIDTLPDGTVPSRKVLQEPSCGTVGCIAGWAAVILPKIKVSNKLNSQDYVWRSATKQLGINSFEAARLFGGIWPNDLNNAWNLFEFDRQKPSTRKQKVLKVLDHVIEHGFDWLPDRIKRSPVRNAPKAKKS